MWTIILWQEVERFGTLHLVKKAVLFLLDLELDQISLFGAFVVLGKENPMVEVKRLTHKLVLGQEGLEGKSINRV